MQTQNLKILEFTGSINAAINIMYKKRISRLWIAGKKENFDEIVVRYNNNSQTQKKIVDAIKEVQFE